MEATPVTVEWEQTPELGELFKALAAAQGEMENAPKSKDNPFFKSKYSDLAAIKSVTQPSLTKYALAVTSQNFTRGAEAGVRTMIGHSSGQWMACVCTTKPKDMGPQAMGSCWSYLRRYSKSALLDIATEDDDGEKGEGRDRDAKPPGANWGRERSAPKAATGATTAAPAPRASGSATGKNAGAPSANIRAVTTTSTTSDGTANDTGEVLDAGQLVELTERADDRWGKGAKTAFPSWLKAKFGTDNPSNLTKSQAEEALGELLASAS